MAKPVVNAMEFKIKISPTIMADFTLLVEEHNQRCEEKRECAMADVDSAIEYLLYHAIRAARIEKALDYNPDGRG